MIKLKKIIDMRKKITAREIADIFNVHVNTIYAIVSKRSWKHIHQ